MGILVNDFDKKKKCTFEKFSESKSNTSYNRGYKASLRLTAGLRFRSTDICPNASLRSAFRKPTEC